MPRIHSIQKDSNVSGSDKLLGSDSASKSTRNFLISDISEFFKNTNAAGVADQFNWKYKETGHSSGDMKAVFSSGSSFANLTRVDVNKYTHGNLSNSVEHILQILKDKNIIIIDTLDPDNFGVYRSGTPTRDGSTDFYKIALEPPIRHNGSLIFNKTYSVKIFGGDVNYVHHQNNAATSWSINHNLGKFPSVTIKFSTGATYSNVGAFAGVTYTDKNNLTINLAAAQSGYAYLN